MADDREREDRIRNRAYAKWEREGRPKGHHDRHWREAVEDENYGDIVETSDNGRRVSDSENTTPGEASASSDYDEAMPPAAAELITDAKPRKRR